MTRINKDEFDLQSLQYQRDNIDILIAELQKMAHQSLLFMIKSTPTRIPLGIN